MSAASRQELHEWLKEKRADLLEQHSNRAGKKALKQVAKELADGELKAAMETFKASNSSRPGR